MTTTDLVGAAGVALLLAAFALNLSGRLGATSRLYAGMNVLGSGLSATASAMIPYWPFVVLEGAWCVVSLIGLVRIGRRGSPDQP